MTQDNCLGFGHLHCHVHVNTSARANSCAGAINPDRRWQALPEKCAVCVLNTPVAVSCPGRKPKRITPFLWTVDNARPPSRWRPSNKKGVKALRQKQVHRNPPLTVVLSPPVCAALWKLADGFDVPVAWIVRRAVEHYLGQDQKGSVRNIAAEKLEEKPIRVRQDQHRGLPTTDATTPARAAVRPRGQQCWGRSS